ncbi:MAG: hypothetical protein ACYCS1_10000 [Gammaproteobacteria bacterium]
MGSEKVRDVSGIGLISLIDNIKSAPTGLTKTIRRNFDLIAEAREIGASWGDIIKALDRDWSEKLVRTAYSKERRRREKKGDLGQSRQPSGIVKPGEPLPPVKTENGKMKTEEGKPERKVHLIEDDESKDKNLFERSKLYD